MNKKAEKASDTASDLASPICLPQDAQPEILLLRPRHLSEYVGQDEIVEALKIAILAAHERGEPGGP